MRKRAWATEFKKRKEVEAPGKDGQETRADGTREGKPGEEEQQVPKGRQDQGPPEDSGGAGRGYQEPAGGACQVSVLVPCYNSDAFLRLFNC